MLLVFGALPPAVLNFLFAERYKQEPQRVASIVLIGNLAALIFPCAAGPGARSLTAETIHLPAVALGRPAMDVGRRFDFELAPHLLRFAGGDAVRVSSIKQAGFTGRAAFSESARTTPPSAYRR